MSRFFNENPPPHGSFHYVPKGKANCRANEILNVDGQTFRNPIGHGWTATPIESPIILDTIFGNIEVVNLPSVDDLGSPEFTLMGGAMAQPLTMTTEQPSTLH
jgi:hypothetical protein